MKARSRVPMVALVAALLLAAAGPSWAAPAGAPQPRTPIRHFIMLMQENHSFDNYFGTYPGADGIPPGVCMPVRPGQRKLGCVKPHHLGGGPVPDHAHDTRTALRQYHLGKLDGFVWALNVRHQNGSVAMGYYDRRELPFHWSVADQYVLFDRFFSAAVEGGAADHMYWVAGRPGGPGPTIFDRLQARGVSWKFYVADYDPHLNVTTPPGERDARWVRMLDDVPLLKLRRFAQDPQLKAHIVDLSQYYRDLQDGTLPAVSYLVDYGFSEHPAGSLDKGQRFVRSLVNSLMASSAWKDSAFLYTYDDWGGWYDHVLPPRLDAHGDSFRVPALLVSAYAPVHRIDHTRLDHAAGLRFIEQNWGLEPLASRDAQANSFMGAFDFSRPPRPPVLLASTPAGTGQPVVKRPPAKLLYGLYATAFAISLLIFAAAFVSTRRPRRPTASPSRGGAS